MHLVTCGLGGGGAHSSIKGGARRAHGRLVHNAVTVLQPGALRAGRRVRRDTLAAIKGGV